MQFLGTKDKVNRSLGHLLTYRTRVKVNYSYLSGLYNMTQE